MGKILRKRVLAMLLCLAISAAMVLPAAAEAEDGLPVPGDGTAFGNTSRLEAMELLAWTKDTIPLEEMETLLNSETLYPQKTGWIELDRLMESLVAPYGTTYEKLMGAYQYLVKQVTYSWEGYSRQVAPAYEYFAADYLKEMTYEEGLQKSVPDDMANRAYHILKYRRGVCYDYAIAFALIARYVGVEAYVHTGYFDFEYDTGGGGHHGWSILLLGGEAYVFDAQRDARCYEYIGGTDYYFGIPRETALATRYHPEVYSFDPKANLDRDQSMLPVTAQREQICRVTVTTEGDGTVSGAGEYSKGSVVTLTAKAEEGNTFVGWYAEDGACLSTDCPYSFSVKENMTLTARFQKEGALELLSSRSGMALGPHTFAPGKPVTVLAVGADCAFQGWYTQKGEWISDENPYTFTADVGTTRMKLIAMFEGDVFYDIPANSWYADYAVAAHASGLIRGTNSITFAGEMEMNRAMVVTVLARLEGAALDEVAEAPFADVPSDAYYASAVNWAYEQNIVTGVDEAHFNPDAGVTREALMAMLMRYLTEVKGMELPAEEPDFTDAQEISPYAQEAIAQAAALSLVTGYDDGTVRPGEIVTRMEGTALFVRLMDLITEA